MDKTIKYINIFILVAGLLIPFFIFINRFLIPDISFDSINYHLYNGYKTVNYQNSKYEFYPTGIYSFSRILDFPGFVLRNFLGYRLGSIGSLVYLYMSVLILYKIFRFYEPKYELLNKWWSGIMLTSTFLSYEMFFQLATYYVDIEVAFLMLVSIYFLLKYERTKKILDLRRSSFVVSVFVLGKMTTWYILLPYFGYLSMILCLDKKQNIKQKLVRLISIGVISLILVIPWWYKNLLQTGNPVFPFYNKIFKSGYYVSQNFSQNSMFGGRNIMERVFWGVLSINNPTRLGEGHDLYNDFKINIYFILIIVVFLWSWRKRNKKLLKLSGFYLGIYLFWAIVFGYLRYGMVLELLGGLILIVWFSEINFRNRNLIIIPIVLLMIYTGKNVVLKSLKYEVSWRAGLVTLGRDYFNNIKYLNTNEIGVNENGKEVKDLVYLNCSVPNLGFMVLSKYRNLPVINIDRRSGTDLVTNGNYKEKIKKNISSITSSSKINFVTIAGSGGLINQKNDCEETLIKIGATITDQIKVDNFLGYDNQKLNVIYGNLTLN